MPTPGWGRRRPRRGPGRRRRRRPAGGATGGVPRRVPPARAACQIRVPASSTGATMGSSRKGSRVSLTRSPADSAPYRVPVAASPMVPSTQDTTISQGDARSGPRRGGPPRAPSTHLEHHQLDGHGGRLAQEHPGRVDARQPETVPGPVGRLDRHAALDGQHRAEQHGHPEQAGGPLGHERPVGAEGEGEQDQGHDPERRHLGEATRDRASMRRSLPATRTASRHMGHLSLRR